MNHPAARRRACHLPVSFPFAQPDFAEIVRVLGPPCPIFTKLNCTGMCQYQTLFHHAETGYVIRCTACDRIQVGFANLLLTFREEDLALFLRWINRIREEQQPGLNPVIRSIIIPSPCEGVSLLLNLKELESLINMMEIADSELKTLQLIQLFGES